MIFFTWLHGKEALSEFFECVNNYSDTIKYTWKWSEGELSYLDVFVRIIEILLMCIPSGRIIF